MKHAIVLAAAAALGLAGCVVHPHGRHHGPVVVIPAAHVHGDHCGHYQHGGAWRHLEGHHHGAGCGHVFRGGVWIFVD